jgi:uncharacterized linocin/CFP29 family protein
VSDLQRHRAPIPDGVWKEIDEEAGRVLRLHLAARKLVDFEGPKGWSFSALALGRAEALKRGPADDVEARLRVVQPLVELRVPFALAREEIEAAARGAEDADWQPLVEAAERLARAEDAAVFHGFEPAGIRGMAKDAEHEAVSLSGDYTEYPAAVTDAIERLREAGVGGPYGIALGPRCHAGLQRTTDAGGYPVLRHVQRLIEGPDVWAPSLDGALVLSLRGGDFRLVSGRDPSIGYLGHDDETVRLYLEESFTFRLLGPEAAVPLVYA